jgi:hypothetical protein
VTGGSRPVRQADGVLSRDLGDEVLLAVAGRQEVDVLMGGAVAVWRLLQTPVAPSDLAGELAASEGADLLEVRAGLDRVLADLRGRGLVEEVAG